MSMTPALEGGDDDATKALKRASKPRTQLIPVRKYSAGDCFGASGALTHMATAYERAPTPGYLVRGDCTWVTVLVVTLIARRITRGRLDAAQHSDCAHQVEAEGRPSRDVPRDAAQRSAAAGASGPSESGPPV